MENSKILGASTDDTEYTIDNLIRAVQWGDGRFVEAAIEDYGMLPNSSDGDHCSLLHWASINNRYDIARYLLSKDVDVNFVGGLNKEISLQWAVRTQRSSRLVQLLIAEGSDVQHKSIYGCDALFIAVQAMNLHAVFVLLNSGANPNSADMHGDTPLYVLLRRPASIQSHDMIRLLLRFKASVNIKTNIGDTAMHIIAAGGINFEVYRSQLIYCSGNVIENLKTLNNEQLTPYDVALKTKNNDMTLRFFYDAYMYTRFPYAAPIWFNAIIAPLVLISIHAQDWLAGVVVGVLLLPLGDFVSQTSITTGQSRQACGMAWGIVITIVSYYFVIMSHHFSRSFSMLAVLLSSWIAYSFLKTTTTLPLGLFHEVRDAGHGLVDKMITHEMSCDEARSINNAFRLCTTCLADKSEVSTHCSNCNRCVISLDHHCPFVCNCVGRGNRRIFVMFLLSTTIGAATFIVAAGWYCRQVLCVHIETDYESQFMLILECVLRRLPSLLAVTVLSAVTCVWVGSMLIGQLAMVAAETTTHEMIKCHNHGRSLISFKALRNIGIFLATGTYAIARDTERLDSPIIQEV